FHLGDVRRTYPEAMLVWIHRDPSASIASWLQYVFEGHPALSDGMDKHSYAIRYIDFVRDGLDKALASPFLEDAGIHHVLYRDLMEDPIAQLAQVYDKFHLPFTASIEARIRSWL